MNIEDAIEEYGRISNKGSCKIYAEQMNAIREKAMQDSSGSNENLLFHAINYAMQYGVAMGFNAGKRSTYKKERKLHS